MVFQGTSRLLLIALLVSSLTCLVACATAGGGGDGDGDGDKVDAGRVTFPDAGPRPIDAAPVVDATPATPDAAGGGPFCQDSDDCTAPGTCCLLMLCIPGTDIGGLCVPD